MDLRRGICGMRVAVVGAGIAGLTFAAAMRKFAPAPEVAIYERDAAADTRAEGHGLGLRGDAGLLVLKRLGLYDDLADDAVTIANFAILQQRGTLLLDLPAASDERRRTERVLRPRLKAVLRAAADVPAAFARPVIDYADQGDGVELRFAVGP